jgi:homocysteine S-methyltransferase
MAGFPEQREGVLYLTEGGQETEVMYKHGHDLPEFAMYPLLDRPKALADMRAMWTSYLEVAAEHGFVALMGGLDYRASPDWGVKLGYSAAGLEEMQLRSIAFLRDVAQPFEGQLAGLLIAGVVGPRGDAYELNRTITEAEAEDYHSVQLATLRRANVDLVSGMTFNNVAESVGLARAAAKASLPLGLHLTLNSSGYLKSGPSVREAISLIDAACGSARPDFFGINCSHPLEFEPALEPGDWIKRVRSIRPNAALMEKQELCQIGHLVDGNPHELGGQLADVARRFPHIDIWGGCCGTWDRHLKEVASAVGQLRNVARPTQAALQS